MDELLTAYSEDFKVNMELYIWYFHTTDEGQNFGSLFFKPPNKRVEQIQITPHLLNEFAELGKWSIDYPEHSIPKHRYDIIFNQIICLIIFGWLGWSLISKYLIK